MGIVGIGISAILMKVLVNQHKGFDMCNTEEPFKHGYELALHEILILIDDERLIDNISEKGYFSLRDKIRTKLERFK